MLRKNVSQYWILLLVVMTKDLGLLREIKARSRLLTWAGIHHRHRDHHHVHDPGHPTIPSYYRPCQQVRNCAGGLI